MRNPLLLLRGLRAFTWLVRDPSRLDEIFALADALGDRETIGKIAAFFAQDSGGARALRERPRTGRVDLEKLGRLPEGTLGRVFADHMRKNGLDPASIPHMESPDELSFVRAHLYETHDIWHAVTGFGADVAGELGLQGFYLAQFPARLAAVILSGGLLNTLFYAFDEKDERMEAIVRGWRMGKAARPFFGVRWAELFETPMSEVRARLGVDLEALDAAPAAAPAQHSIAA